MKLVSQIDENPTKSEFARYGDAIWDGYILKRDSWEFLLEVIPYEKSTVLAKENCR